LVVKKGLFLVCLYFLLLDSKKGYGQTKSIKDFQSFSTWFEATFSQKISKKLSVQLDFQYRRRSQWSGIAVNYSQLNPVRLPTQIVFRPWIHYHSKFKLRFSLSPIGYWHNYNFATNGEKRESKELRTSCQIIHYFGTKIKFNQRVRYELRFRSGDLVDNINSFEIAGADFPISPQVSRLRYQIKCQFPLSMNSNSNRTYLSVSNELFLGLGSIVKNGDHIDQNRFGLSYGFQVYPKIKVECGYLNHWVIRKSDPQLNHCISINLIFENVGELFHGDSGAGD